MKLGLFLAIGESLKDFQSKGQLRRLLDYNVKEYATNFTKVYIFSYNNEKYHLPQNVKLVTNKYHLHRYLYSLLLPIINYRYIRECDVLRGLQLTGGIPALFSKILFGKKFVVNYGYDYSNFAIIEGKPLQSWLYKIIKVPILTLADLVIVPSKTIFKRLEKSYQNKVVFIANGVDTKLFYPPKARVSKKNLELVFIGRLEEQKNLDNLIKAVGILKDHYTLTFYGAGSKREQLLTLAKELKVGLQIKAPVPYRQVAKILRSSDIFILPSYKEGSSKILLEAMSSGCATVASDIPEIAEIITNRETGMLSGQTPEELANAINKLEDFKTRRKLGQNARKTILNQYEINKLLTKETAILKNLAK